MTSYVLNDVFVKNMCPAEPALADSENGCADRDEMLDMDDYKYVPVHARRTFDNEFLQSTSGWQTCTKDKNLQAVDKLDDVTALLQRMDFRTR